MAAIGEYLPPPIWSSGEGSRIAVRGGIAIMDGAFRAPSGKPFVTAANGKTGNG